MRVVHVSTSDSVGGAAKAAFRLHRGLRAAGTDSRMLVGHKTSGDPFVTGPSGRIGRGLASLRRRVEAAAIVPYPSRVSQFSSAWVPDRISANLAKMGASVAHLHWVGHGFMRIESVARVRAPIVWTLHDSWAFTGGCHLPGPCVRFTDHCRECPVLGVRRGLDLADSVWTRKQRAWARIPMTIVTPSRWLAARARSSPLLRHCRFEVIPNGIDTEAFMPMTRTVARERLGLPLDGRPIVLFSAMWAFSDPNKGYRHLVNALKGLPNPERLRLVVAGATSLPQEETLPMPVTCLGTLRGESAMALVNAAADVVAVPSREENLPNTVMEALAVGTPVVAFQVGGIPDLVVSGLNGILVAPYDEAAFAAAILEVLGPGHERFARQARVTIEEGFTLKHQSERYQRLYDELTGRLN